MLSKAINPSPRATNARQKVTASCDQAMQWVPDAFDSWLDRKFTCQEQLVAAITGGGHGRKITTSGSFSGVGSPEIADDCFGNCSRLWLESIGLPKDKADKALSFEHMWAIEWDKSCTTELQIGFPGMCVFSNILEFAPPRLHAAVGLGSSTSWPPAKLRKVLPTCEVRSTAYCTTHKKMCVATSCHKHVAGSPCTDASSFGDGLQFEGKQAKFFYIWIAMRRKLREPLVIHENVPQFGDAELRSLLGDLYCICRITTCPTKLGWCSRRPRQFCILILKAWVYQTLAPLEVHRSPQAVHAHLQLEDCFLSGFVRKCGFQFQEYMIGDPEQIEHDCRWAASRKSVVERHSDAKNNISFSRDRKDGFLAALSLPERKRVCIFTRMFGAHAAFDLSQSEKRPLRSSKGNLPTVLKNVGLLYVPKAAGAADEEGRWFIPQELFTSMGYPITQHHVELLGGTRCAFSNGVTAPQQRSHRSMSNQCGNAMNINAIGAVQVICLLQLPQLGSIVDVSKATVIAKSFIGSLMDARAVAADHQSGSDLELDAQSLMRATAPQTHALPLACLTGHRSSHVSMAPKDGQHKKVSKVHCKHKKFDDAVSSTARRPFARLGKR